MLIERIGLIKGQEEGKVFSLAEVLSPYVNNDEIFLHSEDYALASKDEIQLFQFTGAGRNPSNELQNFKTCLNEFYLYIEYKDVYGHKYQKTVGLYC